MRVCVCVFFFMRCTFVTMAKKCRPDQRRNPETGRCVKKSGSIGRALAGKKRKPTTKPKRKPAAKPKPKRKPKAAAKSKRKPPTAAKKRSRTLSNLLSNANIDLIPKKYFLTIQQARSIADGHGIAIVHAPQSYEAKILNADHLALSDRHGDGPRHVGFFYDPDGTGIARSVQSNKRWIIDVDGKLRDTLERLPSRDD